LGFGNLKISSVIYSRYKGHHGMSNLTYLHGISYETRCASDFQAQ